MASIFTYLEAVDLGAAALVCKGWCSLLSTSAELYSPWFFLLRRDYLLPSGLSESPTGQLDWARLYKNYSCWFWSPILKGDRIELFDKGRRALLTDAAAYVPVLTEAPISAGLHYFELTVLRARPKLGLSTFGFGVDTSAAVTNGGWHVTPGGVIWTHKGAILNKGTPPVGERIQGWKEGDVIGMLISMSEKKEEDSHIRWFKNGAEVNGRTTLPISGEDMHVVCLMSGALEVQLRYRGCSLPSGYIETHRVWQHFTPY